MGFCFYSPNSFLNYFDENKFISLLTSFTFLVIFTFIYILRSYTFFERRHIPQGNQPTAPFGNIKDVLFQEITLFVYLTKYYNKFKRKGFKFAGLYLFFKPSVLVVNPVLMQQILKEKGICDVQKSNCLDRTIVDLFSDHNIENFLVKSNVIKDSFTTYLNNKNMSAVLHNFVMDTTLAAFGFQKNLDLIILINSLLRKKIDAGFKHYFNLVCPLFTKNNKPTQEMQDVIKEIITYRKKNDVKEKDILQFFIELYNNDGSSLDEIVLEVFNICIDNIIHCYNSLIFCLYELGANKGIQENVWNEIRKLNEEDGSLTLKALQEFHHLDSVIKETLRKYPPVPILINKCEDDYKNNEFNMDLPKGTIILYSIMGIHRDPTNFPDPMKFNPTRFFGNEEYDNYMPFGYNSRKEIGLKFTTVHIKLGVIRILSSYRISLNTNNYSLEFDNTKLVPTPKEPLDLIFEPLPR